MSENEARFVNAQGERNEKELKRRRNESEPLLESEVLMQIIGKTEYWNEAKEAEATRTVFNCFKTHSLREYGEDVRNGVIGGMLGLMAGDAAAAKFGLDLFIAVFCTSKREVIGEDVAGAVLAELGKFFGPGQSHVLLFLALSIAIQLSGESYACSRMVASVLPLEALGRIILDMGLPVPCRKSAVIVFCNVVVGANELTEGDAALIIGVISQLIDGYVESREYAHLLQEAVYCATVFIETYVRWQGLIEASQLLPKLNVLLTKKHAGLKVMILKFAGSVFASFRCGSAGFDLDLIISHITHSVAAVQVEAVRALCRLAEHSTFTRQTLIDKGVVERIATCLEAGAFKAKTQCVRLLIELSRDGSSVLLAKMVDGNVFELLLALMPMVSERPALSILHMLLTAVQIARKAGLEEKFVEHMSSTDAYDILSGCLEMPNGLIADNAQTLIDELGLT